MKQKLILGALAVLTLTSCGVKNEINASPIVEEIVRNHPNLPVVEIVEYEFPEVIEEAPTIITYRVTAYCACAKCCGKWANDRPLDENGDPIVIGAGGVELVSGYSCAGTLPFGTKVELEGYGVVEVQDRFASWIVDKHGENILDLFINDHEKAWEFGVKYLEGVIVNDA